MSYRLTTKSGIDFFTISSAFQKCVRRGLEKEVLWLGSELYISGFAEYCWYRMRVIVSEDVGLANPQLASQVQALYQTFQDFKKKKNKNEPEKLCFVHALLLIIRSPKSRLVDNLLCEYFFLRDTVEEPDFSNMDFIFDCHTQVGKKLNRGNDFFYEISGHIENIPDFILKEEFEIRDRVWNKYKQEEHKNKYKEPDLFNEIP